TADLGAARPLATGRLGRSGEPDELCGPHLPHLLRIPRGEGDPAHARRPQRRSRGRRHRTAGDDGDARTGDARIRPLGHRAEGTAVTALRMTLAPIEGRHLLAVVDEYITLLDGPRDEPDPALERLSPAAYPDDAAASAEFRLSTREDGF